VTGLGLHAPNGQGCGAACLAHRVSLSRYAGPLLNEDDAGLMEDQSTESAAVKTLGECDGFTRRVR
jgi:hypothetical protein